MTSTTTNPDGTPNLLRKGGFMNKPHQLGFLVDAHSQGMSIGSMQINMFNEANNPAKFQVTQVRANIGKSGHMLTVAKIFNPV